MAIYDLTDPTDPKLLDFSTHEDEHNRFKRIQSDERGVYCEIRLNPDYEAVFGMTSDCARDVAVRLIDAAEKADFEQAQRAKKAADELQRAKESSELRKLGRKTKRAE
jgi:hypothetical protein